MGNGEDSLVDEGSEAAAVDVAAPQNEFRI
jgi:hypothetical protein